MSKIVFNKKNIPSKRYYVYAKRVKTKYPNLWSKYGNDFGNKAFRGLEKVIKRGNWKDSEESLYIKWQSFLARNGNKRTQIGWAVSILKWLPDNDTGLSTIRNTVEKYTRGKK